MPDPEVSDETYQASYDLVADACWGDMTVGGAALDALIAAGWRPTAADLVVVHEWRVTGEPGAGYPTYDFTYRSDWAQWPGEQAERKAREFIARVGDGWDDGPRLQHRTITYTPWEAVDA